MRDLDEAVRSPFRRQRDRQVTRLEKNQTDLAEAREEVKNWTELRKRLKKGTFAKFALWPGMLKRTLKPFKLRPLKRERARWHRAGYMTWYHWRPLLVRLEIAVLWILRLVWFLLIRVIAIGVALLLLYLLYQLIMLGWDGFVGGDGGSP